MLVEVAKPAKFGANEKLDIAGAIGRHRNPMMPDDRRERDSLNAGGQDFGKVGKLPHAFENIARADDHNVQMEKPMQIAEPRVQQEEDQVSPFGFLLSQIIVVLLIVIIVLFLLHLVQEERMCIAIVCM